MAMVGLGLADYPANLSLQENSYNYCCISTAVSETEKNSFHLDSECIMLFTY